MAAFKHLNARDGDTDMQTLPYIYLTVMLTLSLALVLTT